MFWAKAESLKVSCSIRYWYLPCNRSIKFDKAEIGNTYQIHCTAGELGDFMALEEFQNDDCRTKK